MSRESQGLQVALIVFAMLTVVLGVATFVFFQQYTAAAREAEICREEAGRMRAAAGVMYEEAGELKRLMGFGTAVELKTVRAEFAKDMQSYGANFPEQTRFYHPLLAYQHHVIRGKNAELTEAKQDIQDWKDRYLRLEGTKQIQVVQFQAAASAARDAVKEERQSAQQARNLMIDDNDSMHRDMVRTRQEADQAQTDAQKKWDKLWREYQGVLQENKRFRKQDDERGRDAYKVADGRICGVSPRLHLAWIDLGRADSLRPMLPFEVYPADAAWLQKSTKKGGIQITRILEDHFAEAHVIDEQITDPILRGDKIHSASWSPRRQTKGPDY